MHFLQFEYEISHIGSCVHSWFELEDAIWKVLKPLESEAYLKEVSHEDVCFVVDISLPYTLHGMSNY